MGSSRVAVSVSAPCGGPLQINSMQSLTQTECLRAGARTVGTPRPVTNSGYAGLSTGQTRKRGSGKENTVANRGYVGLSTGQTKKSGSDKENVLTACGYAGMSTKKQISGTENQSRGSKLSAKIVEKNGDVVVWGPSQAGDKQGARLPRIICYGDSNTAGYHSRGNGFQPYGQSLASELAELGMPCEVAVCGLCSFTTQDMLNGQTQDVVRTQIGPNGRGLSRMLDDAPANLVIIMTGTNDLGKSMSQSTIVQHIEQLHGICHSRGIPTVAIAATQSSGRMSRNLRQGLADAVAKWASSATNVIGCLDVEDIVPRAVGKDGSSNNTAAGLNWEPDDLHLSAVGSMALGRKMAHHVSLWLQRLAGKSANVGEPTNASVPSQVRAPLAPMPGPLRSGRSVSPLRSMSPLGSTRSPLGSARSVLGDLRLGGCGFAGANNGPRRQNQGSRAQLQAAGYVGMVC